MANSLNEQLISLLKAGKVSISNIKPSEWCEQNVMMGKPFPGPYRYSFTPYWREVIDCFAKDHPMKWMAIKKGAQIGFSSGVLIPELLWMIKNDPSNAYFLVGSPNLIEKATEKLDIGINNAGLRNYIKPQVLRRRNQKSGDTNNKKEFIGGYIHIGSANNHEEIRDVSLKYGLFDDWESVKGSSKKSGDTRKLLEQRFAAYADTHKICYGSTPELEDNSNIEAAYLLGDQRKYLIPCPCCGVHIELKWSIKIKDFTGGITWKLDEKGKLIDESVGYICQECGGFFDDKNKSEWLLERGCGGNAYWKPTCEPSKEGYYSYHISSLYAPIGMFDWKHYVNDFLEANPIGQPRKENLHKVFTNVVLGETYKPQGDSPKANQLQKNIRDYEIGIIPETLSEKDGNGKIVLLTLACDLNGKIDDARLDYEIVGWSESGSSYSIDQGSIGTFIPKENSMKNKTDREHWTYEYGRVKSVWPVFDEIRNRKYKTDTGREMEILITGVDTGQTYNNQAYDYVERKNDPLVIGLKGKDADKYIKWGVDVPTFKNSREKPDMLYLVEVGVVKDSLAEKMKLIYDPNNDDFQPSGFMNYPIPANKKYLYDSFFSHYEAEHRVVEVKENEPTAFRWVKKQANSQNHFWDVRVYNMVLKDIVTAIFCKQFEIKNGQWSNFVDIIMGRK